MKYKNFRSERSGFSQKYLGNLLEKWKIGKIEKQLYLCQTSFNHCQFFSHIVKFDFGYGFFLWNCDKLHTA